MRDYLSEGAASISRGNILLKGENDARSCVV